MDPIIGGKVKAEAIATISLNRNKLNEIKGKLWDFDWPKCWAKALSLIKLAVVFTPKEISSFTIEGEIPDI